MPHKTTPLWYLGSLSAFSLLSFDLYQPALPTITQYFHTSHALGQLTLSLFFFIYGLSQLLWGPLIDYFGRKKILKISLILFFLATLICVFAVNIYMLILGRAIQGFAVCCPSVVSFSSSRDISDSGERARVLSHIAMIVFISPILAPLIGSVIFIYYSWQATFILMIIIGLTLYFLVDFTLRESPFWLKSPNNLLYTLSTNYKELLSHRNLWLGSFTVTASYSCVIIVIVNGAYLVIDNLHHSPFLFSLLLACNGLTLIIGNFCGIKLREKKSLYWNIHAGSTLMLFGSIAMLVLYAIVGLSLISLLPILIISFAISLTNAPIFSLILANYQQQAGTATAVVNTIRTSFASIIAGIVGAVLVYHSSLLAVSLFLCSLSCCILSHFIHEKPGDGSI